MTNASFEDRLTAYAELLVRVGVNVQPGQKLLVRASTESAPLVRKVAEIAYRIGSPLVDVHWNDDGVTRARFLHGPEGSFSTISEWRAKAMIQLAEEGAASLAISSDDPDMLAGTDPDRFSTYMKAWRPAVKPYSDVAMNDGIAWSVAAAAAPAWAKRVFPGLPESEAVAKLWDAIFAATRIDEPDPVAAWRAHTDRLKAMKDRLNDQRFAALRFRAPGTDLRVGLADGHVWDGGVSRTPVGTEFVANMPTEEVFTAPHRAKVDGVVRASMPLAYNGTIIDDFALTFEAGRVVEARAGSGQKALDNILDTDEGSRRLGEVALVPASSPIAKTGILFLETLFDENAACHIALGKAYGLTVKGSDAMTPEQRTEVGMNESLSHVDFMIGSAEMDVDGERANGELVPVLRQGEWVR